MQREKRDKHFIKKPIYPGGRKAMQEFVKANLKYPAEALEARVEGTVTLKYKINHKGDVTDTHIISGIGSGCDEEAQRIARLLKFEVPKSGKKVRVTFTRDLHVHFRLPKHKPKQIKTAISINYTLKPSKPATDDQTIPGKKGYSYIVEME